MQQQNDPRHTDPQHTDLLHAAITLAGIALGLVALFADHPASAAVRVLVFVVGVGSIFVATLTLRDLFEQGTTDRRIYRSITTMGIMFWVLLLLGAAYVLTQFPEAGNAFASWLQTSPQGGGK